MKFISFVFIWIHYVGDDGSNEKVDLSWLINSFKDDKNGIYEGKEFWNKTSIEGRIRSIDCKDFLTKKDSLTQLFQGMNERGLVLIKEVFHTCIAYITIFLLFFSANQQKKPPALWLTGSALLTTQYLVKCGTWK